MSLLVQSKYKPARGGHAPGDVREAFLDAVEALYDWKKPDPMPMAELRDRKVPAVQVCGLLWNCTDTLPSIACSSIEDMTGHRLGSYAQAARAIKAWLIRESTAHE